MMTSVNVYYDAIQHFFSSDFVEKIEEFDF